MCNDVKFTRNAEPTVPEGPVRLPLWNQAAKRLSALVFGSHFHENTSLVGLPGSSFPRLPRGLARV